MILLIIPTEAFYRGLVICGQFHFTCFHLFPSPPHILDSMNPEAPVGPSISAGSLPASQMNPAPTPTIPCSPSLAHRTPKTIHTYCSSSSNHTAPTTIPCTISGPVTAAAPLRSRAFHVMAPVPSLSTGTFWVGVAKCRCRKVLPVVCFSSCRISEISALSM